MAQSSDDIGGVVARQSWDRWEQTWQLHAQTRGFRRRHAQALEIIGDARLRDHRLYGSLSGGKDSVAMAGLIEEAGYADVVTFAHCNSALTLPDTLETCDAVAERLDLSLELIVPKRAVIREAVLTTCRRYGTTTPQTLDEWGLLEAMPAEWDVVDRVGYLWHWVAAGALLRDWCYETGWDGWFVGIRGDESRGRRDYATFRGPIYRSVVDTKVQVAPVLYWSGHDIMAYLHERSLPLHPYYRRAYEACSHVTDPADLRIDLLISPQYPALQGSMQAIKACYPDHWRRVIGARPELGLYVT